MLKKKLFAYGISLLYIFCSFYSSLTISIEIQGYADEVKEFERQELLVGDSYYGQSSSELNLSISFILKIWKKSPEIPIGIVLILAVFVCHIIVHKVYFLALSSLQFKFHHSFSESDECSSIQVVEAKPRILIPIPYVLKSSSNSVFKLPTKNELLENYPSIKGAIPEHSEASIMDADEFSIKSGDAHIRKKCIVEETSDNRNPTHLHELLESNTGRFKFMGELTTGRGERPFGPRTETFDVIKCHQGEKQDEDSLCQETEEHLQCLICFDDIGDHVFLPCGHGKLCVRCSKDIWKSAQGCHLCKQVIFS